ncbi:MAG TPA: DMT family transporter [Microbacteriaceae bacterium]|nr:DMT family transporter [Microbacteriaceae bacterium]
MSSAGGSRTLAIAALAGTTLSWAGIYIVGDGVVETIDPISLTFLRWGPAAILLLIIAQLVERPDWRAVFRQWPKLLLLGCLGMVGFSILMLEGLRQTSPVNSALIGASGPVLIAVAAALLLRQRIGWRMIVGLAISLVGVVLVVTQGSWETLLTVGVNPGDLWVILATICWAIYTIVGRIQAGIPVITSAAVQALLATIVLGVIVSFTGLKLPEDTATWVGVGYIAFIGSALAMYFWTFALRTLQPAVAGILLNLNPFFTVCLTLIIGGTVGGWEIFGGLVIIGGVLLGTVPGRRPSTRPAGSLRER